MVPKIIHHIVGSKRNILVERCLESWQVLGNHGFDIIIWNDESIFNFIAEYFPFALDAIKNARNHAEAADIARYLIVYHFGGYYLDWDIELLNLSRFLELTDRYTTGYLVQDPLNSTIASEAFSAMKGEKFLLTLAENICYIYQNGFRDTLQTPQYSGPYRMREVYYLTKKSSSQRLIPVKEIFLFDYLEIRRPPVREVTVPMVHYWMHSWIK